MNNKKKKMPVGLIIAIIAGVILLRILLYFTVYHMYRFPIDSIANYPDTHWRCDKLGLEIWVDKNGYVSGTYDKGTDIIPLNVAAHSATTGLGNHIIVSADDDQLYLHCFYSKINDGIFYVMIDSTESTLDVDGIANIVPYKFQKIRDTGQGDGS